MTIKKQVDNTLMELENSVSFALDLAKKNQADQVEVAISKRTGLSVDARDDDVETVEFNHDSVLGISVYKNGCKGNASTSDLSEEAITSALNSALNIAKYTSSDDANGIANKEWLATNLKDLDLFHAVELDPDKFIQKALDCETLITNNKKIKCSDGTNVSSSYGVKVYGNSHGFINGYATSRHSLSSVLIAADKNGMQRDYAYSVARDINELKSNQQIVDEAITRTISRLNARKLNTCEAPVIFDKSISSSFLGHFVSAISGSNIYRKSSFLLNSLDKEVFPSWLNIVEDPFILKGLGSSPFDSEGVQVSKQNIVSNGHLNTYLFNSYFARKLNTKSSGHAGGIHNWSVSNSNLTDKELLAQMGTGLLVTELMGQGVNIVTGDYSRGASGFWVENGIIQYPVNEITIAGNLQEMFKNILAIGSEIDQNSAISCGSILLDKIKIAGN